MPSLEYFVVAESYSVDRDSNSISIFKVLNELKVASLPTTIPRLVMISCWISNADEIATQAHSQMVVQVSSPGKSEEPFRSNFVCDVEFQHVLIELNNFEIAEPGQVRIELQLNGEHKATHTIVVKQVA